MTDLSRVDSAEANVKDEGAGRAVINGPERLEVDDSMPTATVVTGSGAGRPRRGCMPCRCTRSTVAVVCLALLSLVLAVLLVVSVVWLTQRPTCTEDKDPGKAAPIGDGPRRVLSNLADDGTPLPWTDIRLPLAVAPESYVLRLRVDPSRDRFHGSVDIDVTIRDDTRMIVLHASSLEVGGVDNIRITHKVHVGLIE